MRENKYRQRLPEVDAQYQIYKEVMKNKYGDQAPCPFCDTRIRKVVHAAETMLVIENNYPYYRFDGLFVEKHLMVVPRRHLKNMEQFTALECKEYITFISMYHLKGYSSMTRSSTSEYRSVPDHLHTHLFRCGKEMPVEITG